MYDIQHIFFLHTECHSIRKQFINILFIPLIELSYFLLHLYFASYHEKA